MSLTDFELTDEIMVAYADGELGASHAARVEAALEADPRARARLREFTDSASLLADTFNPVLQAAIPPRLIEAVSAASPPKLPPPPTRLGNATRSKRSDRSLGPGWHQGIGLALAASVVLAVAVLVGYSAGRWHHHSPQTPLAGATSGIEIASGEALSRVLEMSVSGAPVALSPARFGHTIEPALTFNSVDGRFCREYVEQVREADVSHRGRGIACRGQQGTWTVELYRREGRATTTANYQPASDHAPDVIAAFLAHFAAGAPLGAAAEDRAMHSGWMSKERASSDQVAQ